MKFVIESGYYFAEKMIWEVEAVVGHVASKCQIQQTVVGAAVVAVAAANIAAAAFVFP